MTSKNLAIIMAAGLGSRMGDIPVPKPMLKDGNGRHFIDDALTFLDYQSDNLDFAVMTRGGSVRDTIRPDGFFKSQNNYLGSFFRDDQFIFQKTKPASLVLAFIKEYFLNKSHYIGIPNLRSVLANYDNIILLPADHKLTSNDLELDDLARSHDFTNADITKVYSNSIGYDSSKKDSIITDDNNRILRMKEISDPLNYIPIHDESVLTSVGVWAFRKNSINVLNSVIGVYQFLTNKGNIPKNLKCYAYFIAPGWAGGRDTPNHIGK